MDINSHEPQQPASAGIPATRHPVSNQPSSPTDMSQVPATREGDTPPAPKRLTFDPRTCVLIPQGARLVGNLTAQSVYIAGELVGNAEVGSGDAVIATTGVMSGQLIAEGNVTIAGTLSNESEFCLRAGGEIDIGGNAKVTGDVHYRSINLRRGAQLVGRLTREGD